MSTTASRTHTTEPQHKPTERSTHHAQLKHCDRTPYSDKCKKILKTEGLIIENGFILSNN